MISLRNQGEIKNQMMEKNEESQSTIMVMGKKWGKSIWEMGQRKITLRTTNR